MISDKDKNMTSRRNVFYLAIVTLLIILFYLQFNIWFGDNSYSKLSDLKKEIKGKEESIIEIKMKNLDLEEEKIKLTSGKNAIEGVARFELGLIKPGETFYNFNKDDLPQEGETN